MRLSEYQDEALKTDQTRASDPDTAQLIPLLGLAGEAGELLSEYKKRLRDGDSHAHFVDRVKEELGDILWYVANVASKYGLSLEDIAADNLVKTREHYLVDGPPIDMDADSILGEKFPRAFVMSFDEIREGQKAKVRTFIDGAHVGAELTDNAYVDDGYRFHDVFHASYAAVLGWSPVLRKLSKRKRRSNRIIDEVEDGGRAGVIEEGIAALVFAYAREHQFLKNVT
jgi:NTP pyrophosphatase (non-canonical NTP hydrolase)